MKSQKLLLSTLAATALLASGGTSANGYYHHNSSPSLYIGWNSNGNISYGMTFGQPHVVVVPARPPVRYSNHHHRNWRPVQRHHREDRRRGRGYNNWHHHNVQPHGSYHH